MSNSKNQNLLAPQYYRYFKNLEMQVHGFYPYDILEKEVNNIIKKIIFKVYPNYFYKKCNTNLLHLVVRHKPDILILFKGMSIFPETLKSIKKIGVILVNYNPDHPFLFSKNQGNRNVINSIPLFDLYITYSKTIINQMKDKYPEVKTYCLPFGYAISNKQYTQIQSIKEINRVCFVGTADKERKRFIKKLADTKIPIDVYGSGWANFKPSGIDLRIYPEIFGLDFWRILRQYRVQLNMFRTQNIHSHNMRSFEIPATGGIMLAPKSIEHKFFFEEDKEMFSYSDEQEAIVKIKMLLGYKSNKIAQIRQNARTRSQGSEYSYQRRAANLLYVLKSIT